jgi:outer membrane protein TolC
MRDIRNALGTAFGAILFVLSSCGTLRSQEPWHFIFPEQRHLEIRDPSQMRQARFPELPPPRTVENLKPDAEPERYTLDDAIRTSLRNTDVVRILAGVTAVSSGQTIYDPAIQNTQIDTARGRFDPRLAVNNNFFRNDAPGGVLVPGGGLPPQVTGNPQHIYDMTMGLAKDTVTGGTASLNVQTTPARSRFNLDPNVLNPQTPSSTELSYTQPLLQGGGVQVNMAPIVIARIDTERSFFQLKDSLQQMVRGVVEGYWALVQARVDAWARRQQVEQGQEAYVWARDSRDAGRVSGADVAQARAALANFIAARVTADATVIQREAALRNLIGLPPPGATPLVPVTPMSTERVEPRWDETLRLAEVRRPDLIELKLILEADDQRLRVAKNQALPRLDAVALYRWNGLEGRLPDGTFVRANPGDFTDWQLGVNFSVPLGLRRERANLRQQELLIAHDRANLEQGLHAASHDLARSLRNLAQYYEQYRAFSDSRQAAWINLDYQLADYREGKSALYLNVLQAIVDWGNSVNSEALALTNYNTELANLEQQTGTILETHGIRLLEERYCSIGPLGRLFRDRPYPMASPPGANAERYPTGTEPSEKSLKIEEPAPARRDQNLPNAPMPPPQPRGQSNTP